MAEAEDTLGILRAARDLLSDPDHWTKTAYARDAEGNELGEGNDPRARCWCLFGAIHKIRNAAEDTPTIVGALGGTLADGKQPARWGLVSAFNDDIATSHADMLALLDRTIARLESEV